MTEKTEWYDDTPMLGARDFENGTKQMAKTIGGDAEMRVQFSGDKAWVSADGTVCNLPVSAEGKTLTRRQVGTARGYADHELGHKMCTDLGALQREIVDKYGDTPESQALCRLANGFEDVRIEQCQQKMFAGVTDSIAVTANHSAKRSSERIDEDDPSVWGDAKKLAALGTTWVGRDRLGYDAPEIKKAIEKIEPDTLKKIEKYTDLAMSLPTVERDAKGNWDLDKAREGTVQAIRLAEQVWEDLQKADEEEPPEPEEGNCEGGEGDGDGAGGSGKSDDEDDGSKGSGDSKSDEDGDEEGDAPGGADDDGGTDKSEDADKSEDSPPAVGSQEDTGYAPPDGENTMLSAEFEMDDVFQELADYDGREPIPPTRDWDFWLHHKGGVRLGPNQRTEKYNPLGRKDNLEEYHSIKSGLSSSVAAMRMKLERAIQTTEDRFYEGGYRHGRLNTRRPSDIWLGRNEVWMQKEESRELDTAVTILVDMSGSMNGHKLAVAQQSTIVLFECLARTTVPLEILGFTTSTFPSLRGDDPRGPAEFRKTVNKAFYDRGDSVRFSRQDNLTTYVFKRFDDRPNVARQTIGGMRECNLYENNDAESLLAAWSRLKQRQEKNKILMVLSDGYPSYSNTSAISPGMHLRNAVDQCEREGANLVGIGIASDAVEQYYPRYAVINNIDDLQKTAMDQIAKMLLGENFTVDNSELLKADGKAA